MKPQPFLAVLLLSLLAPAASGATLAERLVDLDFPSVVLTVGGQTMELDAHDAKVTGQTASDVRKCIDNSNCIDPQVRQASVGNADGTVTQDEVDGFSERALFALNGLLLASQDPGFVEFRNRLRDLVRIDGTSPSALEIIVLHLGDATGSITSTAAISVSFTVRGEFDNVDKGKRHTITISRQEADTNFTKRLTIRAASGWSIDEESISPPTMSTYFADGEFSGSQQDFESTTPLTFDIQKTGGFSTTTWFILISLLLLLAGLGAFLLAQRKRRKGGPPPEGPRPKA